MNQRWAFPALIAGALVVATPAWAQLVPIPDNAVWLAPARATWQPDTATLRIGETRSVAVGETMFGFHITPPRLASTGGGGAVTIGGQRFAIEPGSLWEPNTPLKQKAHDDVVAYCSTRKSDASALAKALLKESKAQRARLCLVDSDHDGAFDHAVLEAIFFNGIESPLARHQQGIEPIPYTLVEPGPLPEAGAFELYFRGFPIQNDRLTIGMRRAGRRAAMNIGDLLINTGRGYWRYYSPYSFVRYDKGGVTTTRITGVLLEISDVDRVKDTLQLTIREARPGEVFMPASYQDVVPAWLNFADSEDR